MTYVRDDKSGLVLPSKPADTAWAKKFHIGESLCWKGEWWRLIHVNVTDPPGVALYRVRPTEREERRAKTRAAARAKREAK